MQVGDWQDIWHLPTCLCEEDSPTDPIRKCDQMTGR